MSQEFGETIAVKITGNNGLARIAAGEPIDEVIGGYWAVSLDRAGGVDYLLAIGEGGVVEYVRKVTGIADWEEVVAKKNTTTRVLFEIVPAPELAHLIGQPSPAPRSRNAIGYADSATLVLGDVEVEETEEGSTAVVQGVRLTVDTADVIHLTIPVGREVRIMTSA